VIAGSELHGLAVQLQRGLALEQQHPLVGALIVEDRVRTGTAEDALDNDAAALQERLEVFAGVRCRQ
jgi:hypothetical protein